MTDGQGAGRLPPGTVSLLAGFTDPGRARAAARAIEAAHLEAAIQVDRVSRYPGRETQETMQPLSGRIESLATLTLGADLEGDPDTGAALSADPGASGLAQGPRPDMPAYLLTVVLPERHLGQARRVVEQYGGRL